MNPFEGSDDEDVDYRALKNPFADEEEEDAGPAAEYEHYSNPFA